MLLQLGVGLINAHDRARTYWIMDKLKKSGFASIDAEDISTRVETTKKKRLMSVIHSPYHVFRNYFP